jgi:hypothetical protein
VLVGAGIDETTSPVAPSVTVFGTDVTGSANAPSVFDTDVTGSAYAPSGFGTDEMTPAIASGVTVFCTNEMTGCSGGPGVGRALSVHAEEGKSLCVIGGRGMVWVWAGMVTVFSDWPWLASVPDGTGTANAARGARRAIENLKNSISSGGDMMVAQGIREDRPRATGCAWKVIEGCDLATQTNTWRNIDTVRRMMVTMTESMHTEERGGSKEKRG